MYVCMYVMYVCTYVCVYVYMYVYVIFKNQAGVLYPDLKQEAIAECFTSDKAHTASFLDVF